MTARYEILPFGTGEAEALALPAPATITVTCSPRHGLDLTLDVAQRLAAHGHDAVPHLAARQVRSAAHLDEIAGRLAQAGIADVFVIGGDAAEPHGPYDAALPVLQALRDHPHRPARLGVGAYPEGHPLIDPATLERALLEKAALADYAVTQLCFDPGHLLGWIDRSRAAGLTLPIHAGLPGAVDRARLLEISMRVGVGASVAFLRKQRGLRRLFSSPLHAAQRLHGALAGHPGVAGLHWYTFNRLQATVDFERASGGAAHQVDQGLRGR